jgi:hypothetical protein
VPESLKSDIDDLYALITGLAVPVDVAAVTYPRGCRIRRVRVPAGARPARTGSKPLILSRRTLNENRSTGVR